MSGAQLHKAAERMLGGKITHEEMAAATTRARRKLDRINKAEGTNHGDKYLAYLIADAVRQNRFSQMTFALHDLVTESGKANGPDNDTKKEPHPKARPFTNHHHCIAPETECQ